MLTETAYRSGLSTNVKEQPLPNQHELGTEWVDRTNHQTRAEARSDIFFYIKGF